MAECQGNNSKLILLTTCLRFPGYDGAC